MPQKLNKAGKMQDYIPKGNGDASGEYGTSNGTNKNFTTSDKKSSKANVITENKSVVVENKKINLPSKEELQKVKDKYGVSSDEDALRIIDKWEEWSKSKEGHDKLVKKLEDRIDNYEGVLENVKNGDETGKEVVEDYTRQLRNAREEYKELTGGKEYKSKLDKEKESKQFKEKMNEIVGTKANVIDNDLTGKKEESFEDFYNSTYYTKDGNFYKKSGRDGSVKKISQKDYELAKNMNDDLNKLGKEASARRTERLQKDTMERVLNKQFIPFESVGSDIRDEFKKQVVNDFYKLHKDKNHTYTDEEVKKVVESYNAWYSGSFSKQEISNLTNALNKIVK